MNSEVKKDYWGSQIMGDRKAYNKKYHSEHKEYNHVACKKWRESHKEEISKRKKLWYKKNKERVRAYGLKRDFNLTPEQYNELYTTQSGCCQICGIHQSDSDKRLAVDHNHNSKQVRGLLCQQCNTALGSFRVDDVGTELLIRAIEYIELSSSDDR